MSDNIQTVTCLVRLRGRQTYLASLSAVLIALSLLRVNLCVWASIPVN